MRTTERRYGLELRAGASAGYQDSPGVLIGYASVFNSLSGNLGGFFERVAPTAFDRALRDPQLDCRALIDHLPNLVIGRTKSGTLQLATDPIGLRATIQLPNTSYARDLYTSVQRHDVSQMSFAFTSEDEDWSDETDPDDVTQRIKVRTLKSVDLMDVSCVTYPAYEDTHVGAVDEPRLVLPTNVGRSLPLPPPEALFPEGTPMEIRSRVGDVRAVSSDVARRRALVNQFFSL